MRYYSSTAGQMTLTADATAGSTLIQVDTTVGLPVSFPYTLVLDPGQAAEEIVTVTAAAGTALTVTRAQDGTSGQAHGLGATVRHMMTARDLREPQEHIAATSEVHGVTGEVVGTTDTQPLTNKDLSSGTNTFPSTLATDAEVASAVGAHSAEATGVHGVSGAVVGTTDTQTLTGKTISGASNTLSSIPESAVTGLVTDLSALDSRLDALESTGGVVSPGITALAGWTINTQQVVKVGRVVSLYLNLTYTGGGFTNGSNGDITNEAIGTLPVAYRPAIPASMSTNATGGIALGGVWTDGGVFLSAVAPNVIYTSGAQFTLAGTYISAS